MVSVRPFGLLLAVLLVALVAVPWGDARTSSATGGPSDLFGDGSDGPITFSVNTEFTPPVDAVVVSGTAGGTTLTVSSASGAFEPGQKIMIHQSRGGSAALDQPNWELNTVQSYALGNLITSTALQNSYASGGADAAQVLVVPQYTDVSVDVGVTVSAKAWDGSKGGVLAILSNGTVSVGGTISANGNDGGGGDVNSSSQVPGGAGRGFRGGRAFGNETGVTTTSEQGESQVGTGSQATSANGMGGGGATATPTGLYAAGGGGGYSTSGTNGTPGTGTSVGGTGGGTGGTVDLTTMLFGGAGGGGVIAGGGLAGGGGGGGGIIFVMAESLTAAGVITATGGDGGDSGNVSSGGGGAGGSLLIKAKSAAFGSALLTATGGAAGTTSPPSSDAQGDGGAGRIRVEYCTSISGGIADPPASIAQISCDVDTDLDGCSDSQEKGPDEQAGGLRDPKNFWDFYDIDTENGAGAGTHLQGAISLSNIFQVANRFGQAGDSGIDPLSDASGAGYHTRYDRGPQAGANIWNTGPADGAVALSDVFAIAAQFAHSCI